MTTPPLITLDQMPRYLTLHVPCPLRKVWRVRAAVALIALAGRLVRAKVQIIEQPLAIVASDGSQVQDFPPVDPKDLEFIQARQINHEEMKRIRRSWERIYRGHCMPQSPEISSTCVSSLQ